MRHYTTQEKYQLLDPIHITNDERLQLANILDLFSFHELRLFAKIISNMAKGKDWD